MRYCIGVRYTGKQKKEKRKKKKKKKKKVVTPTE